MKYIHVDLSLVSHFEETEEFNKLNLETDTLVFDKKTKLWSRTPDLRIIDKMDIDIETFYYGSVVDLPVTLDYTNHITGKTKNIKVGIRLFNPHNFTGSELRLGMDNIGIFCDNFYSVIFINGYLIILKTNGTFDAVMHFKEYLHRELDKIDGLSAFPEYDTLSLFCEIFKPMRKSIEPPCTQEDLELINLCLASETISVHKIFIKLLESDVLSAQLENLDEQDPKIYFPELQVKELSKLCISSWRANEPNILNFLCKYDSIFFNWRVKDLYRRLYENARFVSFSVKDVLFILL